MIRACLLVLFLSPLPVTAAPPNLVVENPGSEPRRHLRYSPAAEQEERFTLLLKSHSTQALDDNETVSRLPPVALGGTLRVQTVGSESISFTATFSQIEVLPARRLQRGTIPAVRSAWSSMIGTRLAGRVTPWGLQTELKLRLPEETEIPPAIREPLQGLLESIRRFQMPFPTEPVGVGSQWKVTDERFDAGNRFSRETTWTLEKRDGELIDIRWQVREQADPAHINLGAMPEGVTARVLAVEGEGSGRCRVDLRRLTPIELHVERSMQMRVEGESDRRTFRITTRSSQTSQVPRPE